MNVADELFQIAKILSDHGRKKMAVDIQFIRWGGLSSVRQKGYNPAMPSFHAPPARRGIYAFVWPYVEYFLLGTDTFKPERMKWIKDEQGNKQRYDEKSYDWSKDLDEEQGMYVWKNKKTQEKWHELFDKKDKGEEVPEEEFDKLRQEHYLAEHIKPKRFKYKGDIWHHLNVPNMAVLQRKESWVLTSFSDYVRALFKELGRIEEFKKRTGYGYSYDHLEVFIEKV
jgi:hypothetical protein